MSKTCTKCGETKPLDGFSLNNRAKDGRETRCKGCVREYQRRYREENRDKLADGKRRYYEENRDKVREYRRRYREENRNKVREYQRRWSEENREKVRELNRRYYEENRDKILDRNRRYREENRDKDLERSRRHYEENRDNRLERARRYREENRDIINQGHKIRRSQYMRISNLLASKKGVPYSPEEDALILADNGMTDYQKAIELGRTHRGVTARKRRLRARTNH